MMPLFCAMKKELRDRVEGISDVDFVADFADDGVVGGDCDKVLKVLEGEARIAGEYGLRYNFDKMFVYPLAGTNFRDPNGVLAGLERLGVKVDYSVNIKFMKVPVVGSDEFFKEWVENWGTRKDI